MSRSGRIPRALAVALLAASCTVTPSASPAPPTTQSNSATPPPTQTPAPTATPTPTEPPPIGRSWELATGIDAGAYVGDVARGPNGWVAVGTTCADDCAGGLAAAWFSTDGLHWSSGTVSDDTFGTLTTVTTDGSTWFAAGTSFEDDGGDNSVDAGLATGHIWRSPDGVAWSHVKSIPLGQCIEGCPIVGQLAAGPGGVILTLTKTSPNPARLYSSADGASWEPVDMAMLDSRFTYWPAIAPIVVRDRFVVTANACVDCRAVWSSSNGRDWTLDGTLDSIATPDPPPGELQLATDGRRAIAAGAGCFLQCDADVFVSANGRTGWRLESDQLPIRSPRVTYAAGMFIAAGRQALSGTGVFASPDGEQWARIAANLDLGSDDCDFVTLVGSEDRILAVLAGEVGCSPGIWVSRAP